MRGNLEGLNDEGEVTENYKVAKRLIGHQSGNKSVSYKILILLDTVGVEWSPDGKILASCSLDGTICFWNSDPNSSQTLIGKIERAHSGFIKGLAWDPAGKFLASQSDDGSCIVWNVESLLSSQASSTAFNLDPSDSEMFKESVLEKVFVNMSKMTFFHRPGWSPDGSLLALANATNRQIPAVALIERSNWQGPGTFFVGHVGPVEAVRFNPRLFHGIDGLERKEMICALASQDGQVSLWSSSRTGPLLVLQELFEHSVMDLAWTPDGTILVAVSYDGAAVAIKMNPKDFGLISLSESEQAEHLKNVFGNRSSGTGEAVQGYVESVKVIECLRENEQFLCNHTVTKDVEMQRVETQQANDSNLVTVDTVNSNVFAQPTVTKADSTVFAQPTSTNAAINNIAQPTMTVNGKKRITPQLVNMSSSQQFGNSQNSQNMRSAGVGVRLRDEDFLIHRKLLERTGGILLNKTRETGTTVFEAIEEESIGNISVPLTNGSIFSVSIEITNHDVYGRKSSALIQFIQNSQILWKERIRGTIYMSSGTRKFSAFAIQGQAVENQQAIKKNFLLVLTSSGRRYLPPIALDSRVIYLKVRADNLISITKNGTINIWNLAESKLKFSDSSIGNCLQEIPMKFLNFDEENLKLFYNENEEITYSTVLGTWFSAATRSAVNNDTAPTVDDRTERIEKLKLTLLNNSEGNERQISELEFELSLIFVNLRNGKPLNSSETFHFERTLAIYALKLAKEGKSLKAKELIDDLKELNCEDLIEGLLKPFFTASQNSFSSKWQDFISQSL